MAWECGQEDSACVGRGTGACVQTLEGHSDRVISVSFDSTGSRVVSGVRTSQCVCGMWRRERVCRRLKGTVVQ